MLCRLPKIRSLTLGTLRFLIKSGMYATRFYGAGSGGGAKQGRRGGMVPPAGLLGPENNHHHHLQHHHQQHQPQQHQQPLPSHPHLAPPHTYPPLFLGRLDGHRPPYHHHHHHFHPPVLPHYHPAAPPHQHHAKKKTWNFIHEKMSYDTFFTMKRLIDRSRTVDEVLRWVTQNPAKVSYNHYPIALQKIGQLLQQAGTTEAVTRETQLRQVSEQPDFQSLCDAIVRDCGKFDNFSIVNCLYAVAALGMPSDSQIVQALEEESRNRLSQFNQKDISMVFSSSMKLHPSSQHPLIESCLSGLEKNIERERHPQTLFLLLSYYRLKWRALQAEGHAPEQLLANRKILRLVKHTLASVSSVRDHEMALLDEMLSACAREASNKSLELIFSSHPQRSFLRKWTASHPSPWPLLPSTLPAIVCERRGCWTQSLNSSSRRASTWTARYLYKTHGNQWRNNLYDPLTSPYTSRSQVIQKLVFPFSRMSYRPSNEDQFFSKLEAVLEMKALSSPLATVNILMSLFQLGHFPGLVLHRVFSTSFISNVTNSPYALIVRRYLSLLDAAVELEYHDYTGPRLQDSHKVLMFDHALTADEVNRKYSYKGLVAEALRQLVGEHGYKQDEVLAPGYYTDFLLWIDTAGTVLPIKSVGGSSGLSAASAPKSPDSQTVSVATLTSDFQKFSPFAPLEGGGDKLAGPEELGGGPEPAFRSHHLPANDYNYYQPSDYYSTLAKEQSLESQDSSTLSSPSDCLTQAGAQSTATGTGSDSLFQFSIGKILEDEGGGAEVVQGSDCQLPPFYEGVSYPEEREGGIGPTSRLHLHPETERGSTEPHSVKRVIMSVNDKWHYCHNSDVLVGSRAMRDRHLQLLGYIILQLPYLELEKLNGVEEVKQYLQKKLLEVPL